MIVLSKKKSLSKFQYFVQRNLKSTVPDNFPVPGSWITLELKDIDNNAVIIVPALLELVDRRTLFLKTRTPFPDNCKETGLFYCSFGENTKKANIFESKAIRYYASCKIVEILTKKKVVIKLIDALFEKANQREYERLSYKRDYNMQRRS